MEPPPRSLSFDLLRGVALLLVMATHMYVCPAGSSPFLFEVTSVLNRGGWIGVDVFFVLSGFLVGGLLFKEHLATGTVRLGRFLLRRGFKIYPLLWVSLVLVVAVQTASGVSVPRASLLAELLFYTNYRSGLLGVTWSLAVEEHFYLLLPLLLMFLARFRLRSPRPFRRLPWAVAGVALVCFGLRASLTIHDPDNLFVYIVPTQLRLDGLFFGVLLAWCCHYHRERFLAFSRQHRSRLLLYGIIGLVPAFGLPISCWYLRVPGLAVNWLAAGALVTVAAGASPRPGWIVHALAAIGRQSYAVYLLHYWIGHDGLGLLFTTLGWTTLPWLAYAVIYFSTALGAGALLTWSVERPILALRDRLFPSWTSSRPPEYSGRGAVLAPGLVLAES